MDENTYLIITLLVVQSVNVIITIVNAIMQFLSNKDGVIKTSKCCGGEIEYSDGN